MAVPRLEQLGQVRQRARLEGRERGALQRGCQRGARAGRQQRARPRDAQAAQRLQRQLLHTRAGCTHTRRALAVSQLDTSLGQLSHAHGTSVAPEHAQAAQRLQRHLLHVAALSGHTQSTDK